MNGLRKISILGIATTLLLYAVVTVINLNLHNNTGTTTAIAEITEEDVSFAYPINDFHERMTKKKFGDYITPENSPVNNDRFTGFHNGVDVEYQDTEEDVPVYAIYDGNIIFSGWVSGYGGVIVIRHEIEGLRIYSLYGHLSPISLPSQQGHIDHYLPVKKGQTIGILGQGYTYETDYTRKHLHFSIRTDDKFDIRGYVNDEEDLNQWVDPLLFF